MKISRNSLGLAAVILAGTACGDTYNTYNVSGEGGGNTENRSYTCEDWATYTVACFPQGVVDLEEQLDICEEMKFESTPEGHSFLDCSYDAQCDHQKLEDCIQLVPELD